MYAIIEVGAKQYQVKKDDILEVDRQDVKEGKDIIFDKILLISKDKKIEVGMPYLKDAKVKATALKETKAKKLLSFKYRRRKSSHWSKGHHQPLSRLKIKEILRLS